LTANPPNLSALEAERGLEVRQYLDLLIRHKMWIILITLGITICVAVVAQRMPNIFQAETVILVDPQKVPDNVVPTLVSGSISDRLSTIRQEVMSPTQISQLITEFRLYPKLQGKVSQQDLVARVQNAASLDVVDSGAQRLSAFRLAFRDTDPQQAAEVANRLAAMFIQRNLDARQRRFSDTTQFIETELQDTKHQLEDKEHRLQEVRSKYAMVTPESKQYHLEALNSLRDRLRSSQEQVNRDRQTKVYLQSMAGLTAPTIDLDQQSLGAKSPYQNQIQKLEAQLKDLQVRYGPNYPEVRKVKEALNQLKAKAEADGPTVTAAAPQVSAPPQPIRNPVVAAELSKIDEDIESQAKSQADLQSQIDYHVSNLQQVPVFEQQIAGLMRDYDSLRTHYNQLQDRKLSAEMASELESHQAGERFVLLDRAVPPHHPIGPKRTFMMMGGLMFGLFCSIGVVAFIETSDQSVRNEREAAQIFGKTVLAGIPQILTAQQQTWNRWRGLSMIAGTVVGSAAIGLAISRFVP